MLKYFAIASVLSATLMAAATVPAQATPSKGDCAYAQQFKDVASSVSGSNGFSFWKQQLRECGL